MRELSVEIHTKSGKPLHPVGIGTWGLGNYSSFSPGWSNEVTSVRHALQLGQNHIDTAEMYAHGNAEHLVGEAIGPLQRQDIYIASKLWKDHAADGLVRPAVEAMLQRLGTDYLDALYIHAPWFDAPWLEAISQIDQLIDEKLVRHLGVSNFTVGHMQQALAVAKHPITLNQVHYSYSHRREAPVELQDFCTAHGTALVAYMPLEKGEAAQDKVLIHIAEQHRVAPAQVALAWLIARGALPIPKAGRKLHVDQNYAAAELTLTPDDLALIDNLVV